MELYTPFQQVLLAHAERYPAWQAQDVYKLAHQAAMGSEHAGTDREHARAWLEEEISMLPAGIDEPLLDPISPDGNILRVHLRPFLRRGLPPELLLEAFLKTATGYKGSINTLKEYLVQVIEMADQSKININLSDLVEVIRVMQTKGFAAAHHSDAYELAYTPAYRVIALVYLPKEWRE